MLIQLLGMKELSQLPLRDRSFFMSMGGLMGFGGGGGGTRKKKALKGGGGLPKKIE